MQMFTQWLPPYDQFQFMTQPAAENLLKIALQEGKQFRPAQVLYPDGRLVVAEGHCRCRTATFGPDTSFYKIFLRHFRDRRDRFNQRYRFALNDDPHLLLPRVQVLWYEAEEGGKFDPHVDLGGQAELAHRKLTFVVPLNDPSEYEGGELQIHGGETYGCKEGLVAGDAVVFPSFAMHSVTPVRRGSRYVAVGWLEGPRFR